MPHAVPATRPRPIGPRPIGPPWIAHRPIERWRWARTARWLATLTALTLAFGSGAATADPRPGPTAPGAETGRYQSPVAILVVLHGFDPPAHRYGAGTVGVDLAATAGTTVVAAAAGTVVFAGPVAGRGVVVITHPDGIRTEYEPLRPAVVVGQIVGRGTVIGSISGHHVGCASPCLHWGARRGTTYLDPLSLLHPLGPVRLLPRDPSSRR